GDVVAFATDDDEAHGVAQGVDGDMQLAGQPAAAAANGAIFRPPCLPVACWCARTMAESMSTYSKSGSSAEAVDRLLQTAAFDQRPKRWKTLFDFPNAGGRSRQGDEVRRIQSTASTN